MSCSPPSGPCFASERWCGCRKGRGSAVGVARIAALIDVEKRKERLPDISLCCRISCGNMLIGDRGVSRRKQSSNDCSGELKGGLGAGQRWQPGVTQVLM